MHTDTTATTDPATARSVGRLPGPALAIAGLAPSAVAVYVTVVPLLSIPVMLATMGAAWALATVLVLSALVLWLCLARRVAVGAGWVADRRLWSYRVTRVTDLMAVEHVDTGHGACLRLVPRQGRAHRLHGHELDQADLRRALAATVQQEGVAVTAGATRALVSTRA